METRVTNCGANVYLVFLPKTNERADFVKFGSPNYSDVSDLSKGYLLTIDKSSFTHWHSDEMVAIECLMTLYGSGENIGFFPPSKMRVQERFYTRKNELIDCLQKIWR